MVAIISTRSFCRLEKSGGNTVTKRNNNNKLKSEKCTKPQNHFLLIVFKDSDMSGNRFRIPTLEEIDNAAVVEVDIRCMYLSSRLPAPIAALR